DSGHPEASIWALRRDDCAASAGATRRKTITVELIVRPSVGLGAALRGAPLAPLLPCARFRSCGNGRGKRLALRQSIKVRRVVLCPELALAVFAPEFRQCLGISTRRKFGTAIRYRGRSSASPVDRVPGAGPGASAADRRR